MALQKAAGSVEYDLGAGVQSLGPSGSCRAAGLPAAGSVSPWGFQVWKETWEILF